MELYLLPLTLSLFLIISIFFFFHKKLKTSSIPTSPKPPGSSGWPVVGETLTYFSMARKGLQYKFITDRVEKYSSPKIFKTSLLGETMAVMCTPEGNKFLFSNENKLVQSWWPKSIQNIFHPSEGQNSNITESTKQLRKMLVPAFLKPQHLQNYVHVLDTMTKKHMKQHWEGKQVVKVQDLVRNHTFELACRLFLSVEDGSLIAKLEKLINEIAIGIISLPINLPGTKYRQALSASRAFCKEILNIVKTRKENTNNVVGIAEDQDLLWFLMGYTDENGEFLSEVNIGVKVLAFLFPAHDTTSLSIVSIVNYLAQLPNVYNQVLREQREIAKSKGEEEHLNWEDIQKMTYSWNVAREVFRLSPSAYGAYKVAIADFHYNGFSIPKGWKLHWNAYATHMNPEYFPDPEKFDPSRFEGNGPTPYAYVPFGGGVRMCPGYEFARLEILVFMHNLVTKYKFEKVYPDEKLVSDPNPAPARGLPVRLYPH